MEGRYLMVHFSAPEDRFGRVLREFGDRRSASEVLPAPIWCGDPNEADAWPAVDLLSLDEMAADDDWRETLKAWTLGDRRS